MGASGITPIFLLISSASARVFVPFKIQAGI